MKRDYPTLIKALILLGISYAILFYGLGRNAMQLWDEARVAVKSYEMMHNHNFIVPNYGGKPDMWSLKPPLVLWMQIGAYHLFGFSEFSARFPSALMALLTSVLLFSFCTFYIKDSLLGLWASLILLSSRGYVRLHVARHADYDSTLIFFLTLSALAWFLYLEYPKHKNRSVWISSISTGLAILTKSIAGAFFLPGLFLYTLLAGKIKNVLFSRIFWFSVIVGTSIFLWHYILREYFNPGYIRALQTMQIGRYVDSSNVGASDYTYYIENFIKDFGPWIYSIPLSVVGLLYANSIQKKLGFYSLLLATTLITLLTFSKAQFEWYEAPVYPILSLTVAIGIKNILSIAIGKISIKHSTVRIYIILTILIFIHPLYRSWRRISQDLYIKEDSIKHATYNQYGEFFNKRNPPEKLYIYYSDYNSTIDFYKYKFPEKEIMSKIPLDASVGDTALICEDQFKKTVRNTAYISIIDSLYNCILCSVDSLKNSPK